MLMRSATALVIAAFLVLASSAHAQVGSNTTVLSSDPYEYDDDYVQVSVVGSWDNSMRCGPDGGCIEYWCDADQAVISLWNDDWFLGECPGSGCPYYPTPGAGWASHGVDDVLTIETLEAQTYFGKMFVHYSDGVYENVDWEVSDTTVQAQIVPVNIRRTPGIGDNPVGIAGTPGSEMIALRTTYSFDPSQGTDWTAMDTCEVWETKTFSGHTPPTETFPGTTSGSQGWMENADVGWFRDQHETQGPLGLVSDNYEVHQRFKWKCNNGPLTNFKTGADKGELDIEREVYNGGTQFRIRKHNVWIPCDLRTSDPHKGWCQ